MNFERSHWLVFAIVLTGLAGFVLAAATLSGFGSASDGDVIMTSTPAWSSLLLAAGAGALVILEFAHLHRRPIRVRRAIPAAVGAKG
jgi:hypothetical protein